MWVCGYVYKWVGGWVGTCQAGRQTLAGRQACLPHYSFCCWSHSSHVLLRRTAQSPPPTHLSIEIWRLIMILLLMLTPT
jgi:hypothetical protein